MSELELRAEYEYYLNYKEFMYGKDVWLVPYERFVRQYPFWCPALRLDLDALKKKK